MSKPVGIIEDWRIMYDGDDDHGYINGTMFSEGWPRGIRNYNTDYVPALSVGKQYRKGDLVVTQAPRGSLHGAIFQLGDRRV